MRFKPHDHRMWAVIGIYGGCEQNAFFQRTEQGLKQHGSKELHAKDAVPLGAAIIHAVTNPLDQVTAAIHVYGGDFFATSRSEWDPESFEERPYDVADTMRAFEKANERSCNGAALVAEASRIYDTAGQRPLLAAAHCVRSVAQESPSPVCSMDELRFDHFRSRRQCSLRLVD